MCVIVCTDLSGKDQHRQVGVDIVVISGNLDCLMVNTVTMHAINVGSIPTLGAIFLIFITSIILVAMMRIMYNL